jgi:hypothetical protein
MAKLTKGTANMNQASNNLNEPAGGDDLVTINFKAKKSFRNELKIYAAQQGKSITDVLFEAVELHKKQRS